MVRGRPGRAWTILLRSYSVKPRWTEELDPFRVVLGDRDEQPALAGRPGTSEMAGQEIRADALSPRVGQHRDGRPQAVVLRRVDVDAADRADARRRVLQLRPGGGPCRGRSRRPSGSPRSTSGSFGVTALTMSTIDPEIGVVAARLSDRGGHAEGLAERHGQLAATRSMPVRSELRRHRQDDVRGPGLAPCRARAGGRRDATRAGSHRSAPACRTRSRLGRARPRPSAPGAWPDARRSTASRSVRPSGSRCGMIQPCAYRAARSIPRRRWPPSQMGGPPGRQRRRARWSRRRAGRTGPAESRPARYRAASEKSARMTPSADSNRSNRSTIGGNGMPNGTCSGSCQPAPSPTMSRPPVTWSRTVSCLASTAGWRKVADRTAIPSHLPGT